jgi:hypothetical protein
VHAQRKCPARVSSYPQEPLSPAQMTAQPGHSAPLQVGVGLAPARPRLSPPCTKNTERGHHPHRQPARTPRQPRRPRRSPEQGRQAGQRGQHYHRSHHAPGTKLVAWHALTPSRPLACVLNMPEPGGRGCRNATVADSVALPRANTTGRQARQPPPRADPRSSSGACHPRYADMIEPPGHHHPQRDQTRHGTAARPTYLQQAAHRTS